MKGQLITTRLPTTCGFGRSSNETVDFGQLSLLITLLKSQECGSEGECRTGSLRGWKHPPEKKLCPLQRATLGFLKEHFNL